MNEEALEKHFKSIPNPRRRQIATIVDKTLVKVIKSGADAEVMCKAVEKMNTFPEKERELAFMNLVCRNLSLVNDLHNRVKSESEICRGYA